MTLEAIRKELERIINSTDYSKDEVMSYLNAEPELSIDELFAFGIALEYLHSKKSDTYKGLEKAFLERRDELITNYWNKY